MKDWLLFYLFDINFFDNSWSIPGFDWLFSWEIGTIYTGNNCLCSEVESTRLWALIIFYLSLDEDEMWMRYVFIRFLVVKVVPEGFSWQRFSHKSFERWSVLVQLGWFDVYLRTNYVF
jgi:hypothetical protein